MSESSGPDAGRKAKLKVAFAVAAAAAMIISGIAIYGILNHQAQQSNGSFAVEPFPSIWQKNFTGTPSSIVSSENGIAYFIIDSNSTWVNGNLTWQVYAVELKSGKMMWSQNLTISDYSNVQPDLYVRNGTLYFIGGGYGLYVNGTQVPVPGSPYTVFVASFNGTTGQPENVEPLRVTSSFATTGTFAVLGKQIYLAWISYSGENHANVSAYSVFTKNHSSSPLWETTLSVQAGNNSGIPLIMADSQWLIIPLQTLVGLDPSTGKMLFSSPYGAFNTVSDNIVNGALVGSTLYYVSEFRVPSGGFNFNLVGRNLSTLSNNVNITISRSPIGLFPLSVTELGSELMVFTNLEGGYDVTSLSGKVLWNNSEISYAPSAGSVNVPPGYPAGVLASGNWILSSVSWPSGSSNITTQYFEEVNPSNGALIWIHQFTFRGNSGSLMFVPPALTESAHVLVISAESSFMVYRWGNSVGCVAV